MFIKVFCQPQIVAISCCVQPLNNHLSILKVRLRLSFDLSFALAYSMELSLSVRWNFMFEFRESVD